VTYSIFRHYYLGNGRGEGTAGRPPRASRSRSRFQAELEETEREVADKRSRKACYSGSRSCPQIQPTANAASEDSDVDDETYGDAEHSDRTDDKDDESEATIHTSEVGSYI
jgi:hypothetical protein